MLFDMVLMDKVLTEKNITLLLNTTLYKVDKSNDRNISSVTAINSQNGTEYSISGQMFADVTSWRWYVRLSCRSIIQRG